MRDHARLRAFELADELVLQVYHATRGFPKEEVYGLASQLRRAAVSVPSNIVEGCARETRADCLRFLEIAFGSLKELRYQCGLSGRLGYMDTRVLSALDEKSRETEKVLSALIRSLRNP